jgi:UV DNA damage endonuclease
MTHPYRLGFAVKVMGNGAPRTADLRKHASDPHLRVSAGYLLEVVPYLRAAQIGMYRIASGFAPYGTHPDMPDRHWRLQHDAAAAELEALGAAFRDADVRLSTHPSQYVVINSPDPGLVARSMHELEADASLLDRLGAGPTGRVIVHVGGRYNDPVAARERWIRAYEAAPDVVRRRLVLENDERLFGLSDVLAISAACGVPVCLDLHHHRLHPEGAEVPWAEALRLAAATWPSGVRPKLHLSSVREVGRFGQHAEGITRDDLAAALRALPGPYDLMLEAKQKDLALLTVRAELAAAEPGLAAAEELPAPR